MSDLRQSSSSLHFYKVYLLNSSGCIKGSSLVMALNDAEALRQAERVSLDHDIEVWDQSRFVGTVGMKVSDDLYTLTSRKATQALEPAH